jgi:hypothetical protein
MLGNLLTPQKCLTSLAYTYLRPKRERSTTYYNAAEPRVLQMIPGADATCRVLEDNLLRGSVLSPDSAPPRACHYGESWALR